MIVDFFMSSFNCVSLLAPKILNCHKARTLVLLVTIDVRNAFNSALGVTCCRFLRTFRVRFSYGKRLPEGSPPCVRGKGGLSAGVWRRYQY